MTPSITQILIVAVVALVLFGRGEISSMMGEVGKGITSFKKGLSDGNKELEDDATDAATAAKDVTPDTVASDAKDASKDKG